MALRNLFKLSFDIIIRFLIVAGFSLLGVNFLPNNIFDGFPLEPASLEPHNFETVKPDWNTKLSDGQPEYIQVNNILGPESIAISNNGLLYAGLADGRLVELDPKQKYKVREVLTMWGENKDSQCRANYATKADECGRILQVRFVNGTLWGVEAGSGLWAFDVKKGKKQFQGPAPMQKTNMFNSFAVDPIRPSLVYMTVTSTKWSLLNIMWGILDLESSGQLIAMDIKSGKRVRVMEKLLLPNGLDVDAKRDQLVFGETMKSRISALSLKQVRENFDLTADGGLMKGINPKALIPLVPGSPDNIVIKGDLAYIAMPMVRRDGKELMDYLYNLPALRKSIGKFSYFWSLFFTGIHESLYPHPTIKHLAEELRCGHIFYNMFASQQSAVIEYNLETGASRLFGSSGFGFISEAAPDDGGNLYLGSFRAPFIVKQKIPA